MNLEGLFEWGTATDTGRVRSNNEDALAVDTSLGVFVLADGMGGHKGGEIASNLAITSLLDRLRQTLPPLKPGQLDEALGYTHESIAIREAVIHANRTIYESAQAQPQYEGMGTTLVVAVFYDNRLSIAHVGDSRIYRLRNDQLEQITSDHTMLQELIDRGFYTEEEAQRSMHRNLVTRALGVEGSVAVDIQEELVLPGDLYLLCSDGLHDLVGDAQLAERLAACTDLNQCAQTLVDDANNQGGKDNISLILARPIGDFPAKRRWYARVGNWFR
ncbi:Stp1/IreP family PP2C-type Ser/Thr phosphatase [Acidihalobacter prosperus]|uniref:PPM-type phosphatase domain-containing protein n=1 Tax=Acidihalobacter prosperus TaxID=160660 RepID=A0A1A6C6Z2_9GAMM|nr:Stp1/IreP family PP2C-type Ser/Thr phosphatase [Acidihalobacter prosperus]OBS10315.1 hypothetical protein Thpro_020031 [Acidihalobacter prosperus]